MKKYLRYLVPAGLIALAVLIVVSRPGPPGLSEAELADIRAQAKALSKEELRATLEQLVMEQRPLLPRTLENELTMLEVEARDLTLEIRLQLPASHRSMNVVTLGNHLKDVALDLCQQPRFRLVLEAGVVVMEAYEHADGRHLRYNRISKDSCRA